jgi:DNA polymerase
MCYSLPDAPDVIHTWIMGSPFPADLRSCIDDPAIYFRAWNAAFERTIWRLLCVRKYGWPAIADNRWVCTMVLALAAGLPGKLEIAAKALRLIEQKDEAGHRLMLQVSQPRKVKSRPGELIWWDDPDKLERLYAYCRQDVRTENAAWDMLPPAMDKRERQLWLLDQRINDRGVRLDGPLVTAAERLALNEMARLDQRMSDLTEGAVARTTKIQDLKRWVSARIGHEIGSLDKVALESYLQNPGLTVDVREALNLRQEAGKSSVSKFEKMRICVGAGDRARGMAQYYGAGTGRWAGRLIQMQNFPKGDFERWVEPWTMAHFIDLVKASNRTALEAAHGRVLDTLSGLLRSCLVPSAGKVFDVADFASIEARVVAWLAQQNDLVELFASGGKVYEVMAAAIFGGAPEDWPKESNERDIGKRVVLGCGFGMGHEKFRATVIKQGGDDPGEELSRRGVKTYREFYPKVPLLWRNMDETAVDVVTRGLTTWRDVPGTAGRLAFALHRDYLMLRLPIGRALWYNHPRIVSRLMPWSTDENPVRRPAVQCMALSEQRQWLPIDLYGGMLAENATQAVARDLLADAMIRLDALPEHDTVLTVHDELVVESDPDSKHGDFMRVVREVPEWAKGCPVDADGWRGDRYKK